MVRAAKEASVLELESNRPGNLFTYDEPVQLAARLKNAVQSIGEKKVLKYRVYDYTKSLVAEEVGVPFTVEKNGQTVPIKLDLKRREHVIARRPRSRAGNAARPRFAGSPIWWRSPAWRADAAGIHGPRQRPISASAAPASSPSRPASRAELVPRVHRVELDPSRGRRNCYRVLDAWDGFFDAAKAQSHRNRRHDLRSASLGDAARVATVGYQMFPCDLDAFRDLVTTVSKPRYQGKFWGWEWLNEITPGGTPDCVTDYVQLCRAGSLAAHAVDPNLYSVMAGGLWPRNYRLDVLNAGAGRYIEVLPIHYGNGNGILEARARPRCLTASRGRRRVGGTNRLAFVIQWDRPGLELVAEPVKSKWVMTRWTDELTAGCEKLFYFGGEGDAIGNSDYLLSDLTPLPAAATLAVFAAKTFHAVPVGVFSSPDNGARFYLFNRDGKALLVADTSAAGRGFTGLNFKRGGPLRVTDYQGNETILLIVNGQTGLQNSDMPVFIEGADLDVLKSYLVPAIVTPTSGASVDLSEATPQVTLLRGKPGSISVRLQNLYDHRLTGTLSSDLPADWAGQPRLDFDLAPGERKVMSIPVAVPAETAPQSYPHTLTVTFDPADKLPSVANPFIAAVISPQTIGNLLQNGDFEELDARGSPKHWGGSGAQLVSSEGLGLGLGKHVLKFAPSDNWANFGQELKLSGGQTYLYTAWVWNRGKEGGSNIMQTMRDGSSKPLFDNQVINIGDSTPGWQVFTCRYQAPKNLATAAFVPVVRGQGTALYDNLRVSVFEGSDFAAEAIKASKPPTIDGRLDDWDGKCPIPLIGRNQLRTLQKDYAWTPQNLSGVAYLRWDAKNLYVAVDVLDDVHHPAGDGESVIDGDSVILAFDPTNRSPDAASKSVVYYVSSQQPAGGSGRHTLWRSTQHSGDRPAGHLARDSSVYELVVKPSPGRCVYELRIPWSELGITPAFGAKFGFSIQLNDNDGHGPAAQMNWGGGLSPAWHPASFRDYYAGGITGRRARSRCCRVRVVVEWLDDRQAIPVFAGSDVRGDGVVLHRSVS